MIRTLLVGFVLMAAQALMPALAESREYPEEGAGLDAVFDQLELSENQRGEVRKVLKQFREDRRKAQHALGELSETLPPQEEVKAMRVYSDTVLEYRLSDVLTEEDVEVLMEHFEKRQRKESEGE